MIYSFDVFDTCLVRLCGSPENFYEVLGQRIAEKIESKGFSCHIDKDQIRRMFLSIRSLYGGKLDDVYRDMAKSFHLPCTPSEMAQLELDTERDMLVPVIEIRKKINILRTRGQIVFISDMYLPTEFIQDVLEKTGFFHKGDMIFVSDDIGAWKRDGSMYLFVHNTIGVSFNEWHHYGDNKHSDVNVPRQLGIHVHHIVHKYLPYEKKWLNRASPLEPETAIMAGLSRAIRLSIPVNKEQAAFTADISAPLITLWISHILQDAEKRGINRLFFLARDMHGPFLVARIMTTQLEQYKNIHSSYLFTSSSALHSDRELIQQYYNQIGFSNSKHTAIVDSCTRGTSLNYIENSVGGGVFSYYLWLLTNNEPWRYDLLCKHPINFMFHQFQLTTKPRSRTAELSNISNLIEHGILINYHKKTIGYSRRLDGSIGPLFGQESDEGYTHMPRRHQIEHFNNVLLTAYVHGFIQCGLNTYTTALIHNLLYPTILNFASAPEKTYLKFLTYVFSPGMSHPYICSIFKKDNRKGRWLLGSIAYSLPTPISKLWLTLRYTRLGKKIRKYIKIK